MDGRYFACCSGVPKSMSAPAASPNWPTEGRGVHAGEFFFDNEILERIAVGTSAPLDRPVGTEVSRLEEIGHPLAIERNLIGLRTSHAGLPADAGCLLGDEAAHFFP